MDRLVTLVGDGVDIFVSGEADTLDGGRVTIAGIRVATLALDKQMELDCDNPGLATLAAGGFNALRGDRVVTWVTATIFFCG